MDKQILEVDDQIGLAALLLQAEEVCKWIGWIDDSRAKSAVAELKAMVEARTGQELMEYN